MKTPDPVVDEVEYYRDLAIGLATWLESGA